MLLMTLPVATPATVVDADRHGVYTHIFGGTASERKKYGLVEMRNFCSFHLHLAPQLGLIPSEFHPHFWQQRPRFPRPSCGVVCKMMCLVVLIERRLVMAFYQNDSTCDGHRDRQTHGQTQGHSITPC